MRRTLQLTLAVAAACFTPAFAANFTLVVGPTVAAQDYRAKTAVFVVRADSCEAVDKVEVKGTAEGLVNGVRRTVALNLGTLNKAGIFAISKQWTDEGTWVVSLSGKCQSEVAGAIIPVGPKGFVRESIKNLAHAPAEAEIAAALKGQGK